MAGPTIFSWISLGLLIIVGILLVGHQIRMSVALNPIMEDAGEYQVLSKQEFGSSYKLIPAENILHLKERGTFSIEIYEENKKIIMTFGSYNLYDAHVSLKESYDHGSPFECHLCGNNAPAINSVDANVVPLNRTFNYARVPSGRAGEVRVCRHCIRRYHSDILERNDIPNIPSRSERIASSL